MQINAPCIITARLLPGIKVADCTISIDRLDYPTADGRDRFRVFIDGPGIEHENTDQASGVGGGSLQDALHATLSFLGGCAEALNYERRTGRKGGNADLFPREVAEWAAEHEDDLSMAAVELEETPNAIEE